MTVVEIDHVEPALIDLNDFDTWAQRVPHDWFAWLRRHAPVFHHPEPDGPGFWVITRWADVTQIGRDPETFSNQPSSIGLGAEDQFFSAVHQSLKLTVIGHT